MNRFTLLLLLCSLNVYSQTFSTDTIFSKNVKDRFAITIRKPATFSASQKYHFVYITDGSIGIGQYILGNGNQGKAPVPENCIIIAISHIGNWHEKRNRDLIPSEISMNSQTLFGHADLFYAFIKDELIPLVEKSLPVRKDRCFIGHSLGGLFCLYTLFKPEQIFDKHYAISPSVWANNEELMKIEREWFKTHQSLPAYLKIYVGGLEFLNKVLFSTRKFYNTVSERKYTGLSVSKEELPNANHFSLRKPVVNKIFSDLKYQ